MPEYGLGRLPAPDDRDRAYPLRSAIRAEPLPVRRYWRTGPVLNQGSTPSCVGHAWRSWMDAAPIMTGVGEGPDAMSIYREAQHRDEWPGTDYAGTSVRGGSRFLVELGRVAEYRWTWDVDEAKQYVLTRGPLVLGTTWYEGMFSPDRDGYVHATGRLAGGHAYLCYGYSAHKGAAGSFRCQNSWGTSWGQSGRFWVDALTMRRLLSEDGECCAALEQRIR